MKQGIPMQHTINFVNVSNENITLFLYDDDCTTLLSPTINRSYYQWFKSRNFKWFTEKSLLIYSRKRETYFNLSISIDRNSLPTVKTH